MPAPSTTKQKHDLERALDVAGEKEYCRLLRALRMARGSFFLFPIESDFSSILRDALMERLRSDLAAKGNCLRVLSLNRRQWDVFALSELETPVTDTDVVVLVGLEETPGIISEVGAKPARPPALALLNQQRELLHQSVPAPFLVWCPPFVFTALIEQAPDFFDQYAGQFRFHNAAPDRMPVDRVPVLASEDQRSLPVIASSAGSLSAATFYEEQVAHHLEPTPERARALLGLADSLLQLYGPNHPQHITRVLSVAEEALTLLSPEQDAYEWAHGQNIMGIAYYVLPTGDRAQNLLYAIECNEAALRAFTESDNPQQWATALNNLGNAYAQLPTGNLESNLLCAIDAYNATLRVSTEIDFPHEWATAQNNLGNVYCNLSTGDRQVNLQKGIACYNAALHVRTEASSPYEWAKTQNNLGNAYRNLLTGNHEANLQQGIACYHAALRVHTEADFPYEWATTQFTLGNAYLCLPIGDRTRNLKYALDCYEAALRVRTETQLPREWADTQFNLAFTQEQLGNREAARQALHCAIAGYRQVGLEARAKEAENMLQQLAAK